MRVLTPLRLRATAERAEHVLQLLRLLLQHADVGHQLLLFLVAARPGRRTPDRARAPSEKTPNDSVSSS